MSETHGGQSSDHFDISQVSPLAEANDTRKA